MNCFDVLDLIEKTSSKNDKVAILRENRNTPELYDLLMATFDYRRTYLIKELPESNGAPKHPEKCFSEILIGCERYGRSQECKQTVANWLASRTAQEAKWYRRVILRDLRCGFSVDTAVNAGFDVPVFEVQLATDSKKCKKLESIVKAGVMVSPKLDGYRCLAVGIDGEFTLYSRNGTVYQNFPKIKAELERLFKVSIIFDGEIMSDSFSAMQQSAFSSKSGKTVGDVQYFIFDCITPSEWNTSKFELGYAFRYTMLAHLSQQFADNDMLRLVKHELVNDLNRIREMQCEFEALGFEGAMANPDIPYYMGRKSNALLKFKSMLTCDCEITGFAEGKGRLVGTLGKVLVKQENGLQGEVGSGFNDEDRSHIWGNQHDFIGRIVEIKFQEYTPDGFLRFPIFLRFRNDK